MTNSATAEQWDPSTKEILKIVAEKMKDGATIQDAVGVSDGVMEQMYASAFGLYQNNKYEKAEKIFRLLCYYNHFEKKYFKGLGGALQMQKKYTDAIGAYSFAIIIDSEDAEAPLHAAHCHLALGNHVKARSGFFAAYTFAPESQDPNATKNYAKRMVALMDQKIKKPAAKGAK